MSETLTRADVDRIARLAHLELTESEAEQFTRQLGDILAYFERLNRIDTTGVAATTHPVTSAPGHARRRAAAVDAGGRRVRQRAGPRGGTAVPSAEGHRVMGLSSLGTIADVRAALRDGATAVDVCTEFLARIAARDGEIGAFNHTAAEPALERAAELDRRGPDAPELPLLGVPVAVKDNICTRGLPTTASSRILAGYVPPTTRRSSSG